MSSPASSKMFSSPMTVWVTLVLFLFTAVFTFGLFSADWISNSVIDFNALTPPQSSNFTITCPADGNLTCPRANTKARSKQPLRPSSTCPEYFRWIHEDLRPWAMTGITLDAVLRAQKEAAFRLIILDGRAYIDRYHPVYQTRDILTIWGILQLLQRYPGRVPDLDLMFNCEDMPVVKADEYQAAGKPIPPPLFRYCNDDSTIDIVFPDWSFWGWPEINIKPWETLSKEIKDRNKKIKWINRQPYAYWKGNPTVARLRRDLLRCNVSKNREWNARLYVQDWLKEHRLGYKTSDLAEQCTHRYKIYIEGRAWSVSEKYILACDSPTLFVNTKYSDFFTRGLMPGVHYWPIRQDDKCRSIKFLVDWGNSHQEEAQATGKAGSSFVLEDLKMDYVYDFMLHMLTEYAKLLKYKPTLPPNAVEYCLQSMVCGTKDERVKRSMIESMVGSPHDQEPCTMPPPFAPGELQELLTRKHNYTKQVQEREKKA